MDATYSSFRSPPLRAAAVAAILILGGVIAWKLLRRAAPPVATTAATSSPFESTAQFALLPDAATGQIPGAAAAIRLQPGGELRFDIARIGGLLAGRFQVAQPNAGAIVELQSYDAQGHRQVLLSRTLQPEPKVTADAAPMHFLLDPVVLPAGTRGVALVVPAGSPAPADWSQVKVLARESATLLSRLPLPLVAYEGFAEPYGSENVVYAHAPMQLVLQVPAGQYGFEARFGYNPAAFTQKDGHSDGMDFSIVLETSQGATTLLTRQLDPTNHPEDQEWQQATVALDCPQLARLRLIVTPGPSGVLNWDWVVWSDLRATPAAKP